MYTILISIAVIAIIIIIPTIWIAINQSSQVYVPGRTITATPESAGLDYRDVTLKTADNIELSAWYIPAPVTDGAATVLFCHGNAGDNGDRITTIQTFHNLGFNTLIFDYRGFGLSQGSPSEAGTRLDALAAWQYLTDKLQQAPENIIIFGRSLGGAVACQLATEVKPQAIILEATFSSAPAMAKYRFPYLPVKMLCHFQYDNLAAIKNITCPVLVAHSRDDTVCPYNQARAIFETANQPKEFVEITGDHGGGGIDTHPHYRKILKKFLSQNAKK